jgi:hypothetical protein
MHAPPSNLELAQKCASLGLFVFPCTTDKKARVKWRAASTTDPEQISKWWREWHAALPAVDLAKSGHVVIDGDRHGGPDGVAAVEKLFAEHQLDAAAVPTVITPGDGKHYWFRQRDDGEPIGNSDKAIRDAGINIRGHGGYVICPGAQLPDGRRYRWDKATANLFGALREDIVPVLPMWLVDLLRPKPKPVAAPAVPLRLNGSGHGSNRHQSYASAALDQLSAELAATPEGSRNIKLNDAALRMGHMIASGWIDQTIVEQRLTTAAHAAGLAYDEISATLASGTNAGLKEPHPALVERPLQKPQPSSAPIKSGDAVAPAALDSAGASTFKMAGITWLWPNRFALGKLGLIAGLPDRGKGLICADMAARVSNGDLWPCDEGRALLGNVLLLSAEDDIEDTIVPRLTAAGADLKRIHIVRMVRTGTSKRMFSLVSDLELLRQKIEEIGSVVMVQIDPISAYLGIGKVDSYRTTDVRGVLAPLTELAAEKQIFLLGVLHFNKKTDVDNAMLRISDSLAFAATARHCYCVVDDPDNDRRLFVKAKNNLAADTKALSFAVNATIVGQDEKTGNDIWAPRVTWGLEHVEITATEAMQAEAAGKSSANPRAAAKTLLTELLAGGPVAKQDIEEAANANCISAATLRRAKDELGIVAKKSGLHGGWTWHLPERQPDRRPPV